MNREDVDRALINREKRKNEEVLREIREAAAPEGGGPVIPDDDARAFTFIVGLVIAWFGVFGGVYMALGSEAANWYMAWTALVIGGALIWFSFRWG